MQFISQALGWEDCVILAMAPLGIITILVSAIRVGGPAWLKAVIGRARENTSAAEMQLMSSTSEEVCELHNGKTIVRCQGSTPVWEFIYLIPTIRQQEPNKKLEIKVVTLEEACTEKMNLLYKSGGDEPQDDALQDDAPQDEAAQGDAPSPQDPPPTSSGNMTRIFRKVFGSPPAPSTRDDSGERGIKPETVSEHDPSEAIYVIRSMGPGAPNIVLNLQNNSGNRRELRAFALVGVILQSCVLVFFGIITYHPTIRNSFRKDDKHVDDYALPLAIGGTLLLVLGLLGCAIVVEKSTQETRYERNKKYGMQIVWIQQKQTVGDQAFNPYATFPDAPRDVVTMSRRRNDSKTQRLKKWTTLGICAGLAGFIIQFIGLRGINSAATLAQLGIIGIMTAIRAWVRRGLAILPRKEELASGFELDALAWALTLLNHSSTEVSDPGTPPTGSGQDPTPANDAKQEEESLPDLTPLGSIEKFMNLDNQKQYLWNLSTGCDVDHQPFLQVGPRSNFRAQQVFETRWNLTRLAQFKGKSATEAVNLATAIEKIMSVLFPLGSKESATWTWLLAVDYRDSESTGSQCHINISLTSKDGAWMVLADQLESVLSLCLFTARKEEQSRLKDGQAGFNLNNENDDWLRQKTMDSGLGIRLLGSTDAEKTDQLIQDLRWWAPETFDVIAELQDDNSTEGRAENPKKSVTSFEKNTREELDQIIKSDPRLDGISIDDNRVNAKKIRGWGIVFLVEYLCHLENEIARTGIEGDEVAQFNVTKAAEAAFDLLRASSHQPDFFTHLVRLYKRQRRPLESEYIQQLVDSTSQDDFTAQDNFPDYFGITELHLMAMDPSRGSIRGCTEEVWNAIDERDIFDWTPLHWAAAKENQEAIMALAWRGADPNLKSFEDEGLVRALVDRGAKVDVQIDEVIGSTLLHFVAENEMGPIMRILTGGLVHLDDKTRSKAINSKDVAGDTALHSAASSKRLENMEMLLSAGADPNIKNNDGMTPLHCVLLGSDDEGVCLEMVKILARHKADARAQDTHGNTPLDLAVDKGYTDVSEYLRGLLKAEVPTST
ncbi:hypothetical protein CDV36_007907 [Fusarium kuroshium]|uniref:Uncharacterized protein n=1 Tax=Fusarium kuroshium TaxID=2010991 RepID=A0A3M2S4H1_9HYPO|nr:hypothetical protein CDV36_007907 [Fusarium kuroshium]